MFQTFEFIFNLCPNKNKILELVKIFRGVREHLCVGGAQFARLKKCCAPPLAILYMQCSPLGNLLHAVQFKIFLSLDLLFKH